MTKRKKIHICMVLDETGSMGNVRGETISGFNKYIRSLKDDGHNYRFSLVKFDSTKYEQVYNDVEMGDVAALNEDTYIPGAMTPLIDTVCRAIESLGTKKNVLFVILTDGLENASRERRKEDMTALIKDRTERGWTFVYLGADHDAIMEAASYGIASGNTARYGKGKTPETFEAMGMMSRTYAARGGVETTSAFADSGIDKDSLMDDGEDADGSDSADSWMQ